MDELKIESKFMRKLAANLLAKWIKKTFGIDVNIILSSFKTSVMEDHTHVHLDVDFDLSKVDFERLIKEKLLDGKG